MNFKHNNYFEHKELSENFNETDIFAPI